MSLLKRPSSQAVGVAWLQSLTELDKAEVATTLPDTASWKYALFVTVSASLGGIPDRFLNARQPVVQVDCWAKRASSNRPSWNMASALAEAIREATYGSQQSGSLTSFPSGFLPVELQAVWPVSEPRRMLNDVEAVARYSLDLQMVYTVAAPVPV